MSHTPSIAERDCIPIPHSHRAELDRRLANYASCPDKLLSYEELQEKIAIRKSVILKYPQNE
jgi:putative addiction module component (TIGR02574 family)